MHALKRHPLVRVDLLEAFAWYEARQPRLGHEFAAEVRTALRQLRENPFLHARRGSDLRRMNLRRFPFGIFYFVEGNIVVVLALLHGRRNTTAIVGKRHSQAPGRD